MASPVQFAQDSVPLDEDFPIAERPSDPDMRDGVNVWFFENNGDFGVPRLAIDAVGPDWDSRIVSANLAFADGRVLAGWQRYPSVPSQDSEGRSTILGSTALRFRCIEPMRKWQFTYDGELVDGNSEQNIGGTMVPANTARVRIDGDITILPPLWGQYFSEDDERPEAGWMGRGWRYEVPCRVEGKLTIDGKTRDFKAMGNLIRRKSKRTSSADFPGHCWLAAHFPDGRAFGCNVYPETDGGPQYNTGYIYLDGKTYDARVVDAPWLGRLMFKGEDMPVVLESELGRTRIEGTSLLSTFKPAWPSMGGLNLHQGGVRFTWGDQTAIGMTERSSFPTA